MKIYKKPLASQRNIQKFVNILGAELEKESHIQVIHSSQDADFNIMKLAFNIEFHLTLKRQNQSVLLRMTQGSLYFCFTITHRMISQMYTCN